MADPTLQEEFVTLLKSSHDGSATDDGLKVHFGARYKDCVSVIQALLR